MGITKNYLIYIFSSTKNFLDSFVFLDAWFFLHVYSSIFSLFSEPPEIL